MWHLKNVKKNALGSRLVLFNFNLFIECSFRFNLTFLRSSRFLNPSGELHSSESTCGRFGACKTSKQGARKVSLSRSFAFHYSFGFAQSEPFDFQGFLSAESDGAALFKSNATSDLMQRSVIAPRLGS
jgi:hypothetical protein